MSHVTSPLPPTMMNRTHNLCSLRARRAGVESVLAGMLLLSTTAAAAAGETFRSDNFVVTASTTSVAQEVAIAAEEYRVAFASTWLNAELPNWETPCPIVVNEQPKGGAGWVSYETFRGRAEKIRIRVTGPLDRIIEYVLPHEIAHATLAITTGRPLPRWADEGVAMLCESESQQARQRATVSQLTATDQIMPLRQILQVEEYPQDQRDLVSFYAACHSLTEYLVTRGGRQRLLEFVNDGDRNGWEQSVRHHYGLSLQDLDLAWTTWRANAASDGSIAVASSALPTMADPDSHP